MMRSASPLRKAVNRSLQGLVFAGLLFMNILPVYWAVVTSLKTKRDIFVYPPQLFGFNISLEHYQTIVDNGYFQSIANSLFFCVVSMALGLTFGYMCAYALQRNQFRLKKAVFFLIVACIPLSIGSAALLIPNYVFMSRLGLTNKWYTMVLLFTAYNLPMAIWILRSGVESVPIEIEEAARIDGCGKSYIRWRIVLPLILPCTASAALFIFIGAWNEFILAAIMLNSPSLMPVQVSIYNYLGFFGQEWGPLTAAAALAIVPTLIIFSFLGKMLVSGLTQGSVKG